MSWSKSFRRWLPSIRESSGRSRGRSSARPSRSRPLLLERLEERLAPATNTWLSPVSGNWNDATKWSDGVPTIDDVVVIDATGATYAVTLNVDATVAGFQLNSSNATFSASSRTFTVNS